MWPPITDFNLIIVAMPACSLKWAPQAINLSIIYGERDPRIVRMRDTLPSTNPPSTNGSIGSPGDNESLSYGTTDHILSSVSCISRFESRVVYLIRNFICPTTIVRLLRSFIRLCVRSFVCSFVPLLGFLFAGRFARSLIFLHCWFVCLFARSFVLLFANWLLILFRQTYARIRSLVIPNSQHADGQVEISQHDTLTQCWINVGPSSVTLAQHWTNIGSVYRVPGKSAHTHVTVTYRTVNHRPRLAGKVRFLMNVGGQICSRIIVWDRSADRPVDLTQISPLDEDRCLASGCPKS